LNLQPLAPPQTRVDAHPASRVQFPLRFGNRRATARPAPAFRQLDVKPGRY